MSEVAAGELRIVVRDEESLVRTVRNTERDGVRVEVTGVSPSSVIRMRCSSARSTRLTGSTRETASWSPMTRLAFEARDSNWNRSVAEWDVEEIATVTGIDIAPVQLSELEMQFREALKTHITRAARMCGRDRKRIHGEELELRLADRTATCAGGG